MRLPFTKNSQNFGTSPRVSKVSASIALAVGVGISGCLSGAGLATAEQAPSSSYGSADGSARKAAPRILAGSGLVARPSDMLSSRALGSLDRNAQSFYDSLPTTVSGEPGQVIKRSQFALGLPYVDWTLSKAERVAYVSTDSNGKSIPVTGTVLKSSAPWTGKPTAVDHRAWHTRQW